MSIEKTPVSIPEFDTSGFPEWNDELEALVHAYPGSSAWIPITWESSKGWSTALIKGVVMHTNIRKYVMRCISVQLNDGKMAYAAMFQYHGERPHNPNAMYPRLEFAERVTGVQQVGENIEMILDRTMHAIDEAAEARHKSVVASMEKDSTLTRWLNKL